MAGKSFVSIIIVLSLFLATASPTHAVMQTLNGQTGQNQTFSNDSNIQISSLNNVHALQWSGLLPVSRGGTGKGSFTDGSIPFIVNGSFSENNTNLFWDNTNKRLGIGTATPEAKLHIVSQGDYAIKIDGGADILIGDASQGQNIIFVDSAGSTLGNLAFDVSVPNGLSLSVFDQNRGLGIYPNGNVLVGTFQESSEGTLQVVGDNSTVVIGASASATTTQHPGCLVMGDSDGDGVTYITANDGVLTASATKPSICQ